MRVRVWRGTGCLLLAMWACSQASIPGPGDIAPDFRLETLSHERFYLNQECGKTLILVFWKTSCAICKNEMFDLQAVKKEFSDRQARIVSVCSDPENIDTVRVLVKGLGLTYSTLLDREGKVTQAYGAAAFPTTVVIGPEGRIRFRQVGYSRDLVSKLLKQAESLQESKNGTL